MDNGIDSEEAERIKGRIAEWTAGDSVFRDRIIREFLAFYPEAFLECETCERTRDFDGMVKVAHSLKSTLSFMGSERAFLSAKELEEALTDRDNSYPALYREMEVNIRQLANFLRELIEGEHESKT